MSAMAAQSSELVDEPPISDIGYNRAVGRPLSLTEFPSAPASPRFPGSRHSMYSNGCRPLRSSPLAGPALRVDESIEEVDEKRNQQSRLPRPSRVLSTPNLATLLTLPPPLRNTRPKTAESPREGFSHVSISSPPAKPSKSSASLFSQRTSENMPPLQPPPLSSYSPPLLQQSRSASSLSLRRYPTKPGQVRGNNSENEPLKPLPTAFQFQRPKTAHGYPTLLHRPITTIAETQFDKECTIPPVGSRDPKDNSWFTANTYDVTPKFSRLGLAASGVVLPVSAKDHKRLSRPSSRSSMISGALQPGVGLRPVDSAFCLSVSSPALSNPDVNLTDMQQDGSGVITPTLTRSSASSRSSDESSITPSDVPVTNLTPLVATSTDSPTTVTTIMHTHELGGSLALSKRQDEQEPQAHKITATLPSKKNKLTRFKVLQYRTSTQSFSPPHHTPTNQPPKGYRAESSHKKKGGNRRDTIGGGDEIKLGFLKFSWFTGSESSLSARGSSPDTDPKRDRLFPVKNPSRMKKLWKSIAMNW